MPAPGVAALPFMAVPTIVNMPVPTTAPIPITNKSNALSVFLSEPDFALSMSSFTVFHEPRFFNIFLNNGFLRIFQFSLIFVSV